MNGPEIRIYNTLQHDKAPLVPLVPGKLGVYVCGPTVYSYVHIGNARTFTAFDVVVRYLRARGYEVRYVRNYTDVDDKIIAAAKETGEPAQEVAERYIHIFEEDARALKLLPPDVAPRVTDSMGEIIALIERLIEQGVAYRSGGDVYFEVRKYPPYLKLSRRNLDELLAGASERELAGEAKRDPLDFALWKAAKPGEPWWDSPWGQGRPGWHIECSAMSARFLGETFDIHGGGLDLIFPHHENELAQSEAATGKVLCNCWMHSNFLDLEGAKMSKSLGNVVRLRDALARVDPEALRYFFLSTHYRQQLSFSDKSLADAETRMEYFYETLRKVDGRLASAAPGEGAVHGTPGRFAEGFHAQMSDDFNVPGALGVVSELFTELNNLTDRPPVKDRAVVERTLRVLRDTVSSIAAVLGLFEDDAQAWLGRRRDRLVAARGLDVAAIEQLIARRNDARARRDWASADGLRNELKAMGVEILDGAQGTTWKVV